MASSGGPSAANFMPSSTCACGVLKKKRSYGFINMWSPRHVVVDSADRKLLYYHTISDKKPSKVVDLLGAIVSPSNSSKAYGFCVTVANESDIYQFTFASTDSLQIDNFIQMIRSASIPVTISNTTDVKSQTCDTSPGGLKINVITMTPVDLTHLPAVKKELRGLIRIGREIKGARPSDDCVSFCSKVISRKHAEIWAVNDEVYIRDAESQGGTFLNSARLSNPGEYSRPYRLCSGDTVQLGVDLKGGREPPDVETRGLLLKIEISQIEDKKENDSCTREQLTDPPFGS